MSPIDLNLILSWEYDTEQKKTRDQIKKSK